MVFHTWHLQHLSFYSRCISRYTACACVCVCVVMDIYVYAGVWESGFNTGSDSSGLESPNLVLEALSFLGQIKYACWPVSPREFACLCLPCSVTTITLLWTYSPGFWRLDSDPNPHCKCFSLWALPRQCGCYSCSDFHRIFQAVLNIFIVLTYFWYCYGIMILERT